MPALTSPSTADPLVDAALLPLGPRFVDDREPETSAVRPFGLRYAVVPAHPVFVDLSRVRYDELRQLCVDDDGIAILDRHTDGRTSTQTSDGHKSLDSDTDHRED
jgi:putative ATP-grasp target RiPP